MTDEIFTHENKAAGELAVRTMPEKAAAFCHNTDPFRVYEYTVYTAGGEKNHRYAYDGCMGTAYDLTFDELIDELESMQDMIDDESDPGVDE